MQLAANCKQHPEAQAWTFSMVTKCFHVGMKLGNCVNCGQLDVRTIKEGAVQLLGVQWKGIIMYAHLVLQCKAHVKNVSMAGCSE